MEDFMKMLTEFYSLGRLSEKLNAPLISLIPKTEAANILLTKVLSKRVLHFIISSPFEGYFMMKDS